MSCLGNIQYRRSCLSTVYITSHNGTLNCSSDVLFYKDYEGNATKLFPDKVEEIVLIGKTTITSGAFVLLFKNNIDVVFLNSYGKYISRLIYCDKKNTILRHRQHLMSEDAKASLEVAKDIVRGKLCNQYCYIQRIKRKTRKEKDAVEKALENFRYVKSRLERAGSMDEVRGLEGEGSRLYFSVFGLNIKCGWTEFRTRTKNPPLDEVNAVLSLLYAVLANRICSYIRSAGLDSGIGTLHAVHTEGSLLSMI